MRTRFFPSCTSNRKSQHGSAILIILTIIGLGAAFLLVSALNKASSQIGRDKITSAALAQAKEALIGYAATYRDSHPSSGPIYDQVFGYLPCPAINGNGVAGNCGLKDVTLIGLLPWKELGLPPLRDSSGECLWYAVSGRFKNTPQTTALNWDTASQLIVNDAGGTTLASGVVAVIFSPRGVIGSQNRAPAGTTECGGNTTVAAYLDDSSDPIYSGTAPVAGLNSTLTVATAASIAAGTNNDQGLWITSKDIFDRVKKRSDFKNDIDSMLGDLSICLNNLAPTDPLLAASAGNKGIDLINAPAITTCLTSKPQKTNVRTNWRDNLLYAKPAGAVTVNGVICSAVLFFGGERTTRTVAPLTAQTRVTAAEKGNATTYGDPAMYLEGTNATLFPLSGAYTGTASFGSTSASADIVRCIKGLPAGATQASFANNFASFVPAGVGVTTNTTDKTVTVANAGGASGGCFWFSNTDPSTGNIQPIPLASKTLRAYYTFTFTNADTFAKPDPLDVTDNGNGFTISFVRGDIPIFPPTIPPTYIPPNTCGTQTEMGVLKVSDIWGSKSLFVETDAHHDNIIQLDPTNVDPAGNHTAIMANGNLTHWPTAANNGYTTSACNGSAQGCLHSPPNKFEESPTPSAHNQRIEIRTGCNPGCSVCNPANHVAPNTYAQISAWVDCTDCNDVAVDLDRAAQAPTINRCIALDAAMNSIHFGFTGGFRSGTAAQGVTISNLYLRSE